MKLFHIGVLNNLINLEESDLEPSSIFTKPKKGLWFSLDKSWFHKLQSESPSWLVNKSLYECQFKGRLFSQDNLTKDYLVTENNKIRINFHKIKNEGYDGFICTNPNVAYCDKWDIASVVVWSSMDLLDITSKKLIPLDSEVPLRYLWRKMYKEIDKISDDFNQQINGYKKYVETELIFPESDKYDEVISLAHYGAYYNHFLMEYVKGYQDSIDIKEKEFKQDLEKELKITEREIEELYHKPDKSNEELKLLDLWERRKDEFKNYKKNYFYCFWAIKIEEVNNEYNISIRNYFVFSYNKKVLTDKKFNIKGINSDNYKDKLDILFNEWTLN